MQCFKYENIVKTKERVMFLHILLFIEQLRVRITEGRKYQRNENLARRRIYLKTEAEMFTPNSIPIHFGLRPNSIPHTV